MLTVELHDNGVWSTLAGVTFVSAQQGMTARELVAQPAAVSIVVSNRLGDYSPAGAMYLGGLRISQPVRIRHGATTLFTGFVTDIWPQAGAFGERTVTIQCSDILARLQRLRLTLPQATAIKPGAVLRRCTAAAFGTAVATGLLTVSAQPAVNDTVTIGERVYTFVASPSAAYQVGRGTAANGSEAAANLAAAINDDIAAGGYGTGTVRHEQATAELEPGGAGGSETLWMDQSKTPNPADLSVALEYVGFDTLGSGKRLWGQRFTPTLTGQVSSARLYLEYLPYLTGSGHTITHRLQAEIYTENGAGLPGTKLAEKLVTRQFTWPQTGAWEGWETFTFASPPTVVAGTRYWLVLRPLKPVTAGFWFAGGWYYVVWHGTDTASGPWGMADYIAPGQAYWLALNGYAARMQVSVNEFSATRVVLTATARGAWGNAVSLARTGTAITLSGSELSGGADYASQAIADGAATLDLFAPVAEDSNALAVMQGVVESEFGRLYADVAGVLRFVSRTWLFERTTDALAATIDGTFVALQTEEMANNLANRIQVSYTPARTLTTGVVARSMQTLQVPGRGVGSSGKERWNATQALVQEQGTRTFVLPFVQPDSGERMAATSVFTPVPGTDYTVTDAPQGGFDYTYGRRLRLSVAITSSGVEVTATNTATGTLYIHNLQVRGTGQVFRDAQTVTLENTQSQNEHGLYEDGYALPYALQQADVQALTLASHLQSRYGQPRVRVEAVTVEAINDTAWLGRNVGDVVAVKDALLGLDTRCVVVGRHFEYGAGAAELPVTLFVYDTNNYSYWRLGHATFGVLGQTTRLAL